MDLTANIERLPDRLKPSRAANLLLWVIAAFVVPRDPDEPDGLDAAPLLAFAHEHLAAYKCPREIIFTDSLPRTANGKVRRRDLARWKAERQ